MLTSADSCYGLTGIRSLCLRPGQVLFRIILTLLISLWLLGQITKRLKWGQALSFLNFKEKKGQLPFTELLDHYALNPPSSWSGLCKNKGNPVEMNNSFPAKLIFVLMRFASAWVDFSSFELIFNSVYFSFPLQFSSNSIKSEKTRCHLSNTAAVSAAAAGPNPNWSLTHRGQKLTRSRLPFHPVNRELRATFSTGMSPLQRC